MKITDFTIYVDAKSILKGIDVKTEIESQLYQEEICFTDNFLRDDLDFKDTILKIAKETGFQGTQSDDEIIDVICDVINEMPLEILMQSINNEGCDNCGIDWNIRHSDEIMDDNDTLAYYVDFNLDINSLVRNAFIEYSKGDD